MSEYSEEDYDDEGTEANGPKALRDQLKKESAARKTAVKELEDLKTQFAEISKANRTTSLKEALKAAGGDAATKIAAFYPADSEVTADAVASWLTEHKDVFNLGTTTAPAEDEATDEASVDLPPAVKAYLEAQKRTAALENERTESPGGEDVQLAAIHEVGKNAKSMQELADGLAAMGAPVAPTGYRR